MFALTYLLQQARKTKYIRTSQRPYVELNLCPKGLAHTRNSQLSQEACPRMLVPSSPVPSSIRDHLLDLLPPVGDFFTQRHTVPEDLAKDQQPIFNQW